MGSGAAVQLALSNVVAPVGRSPLACRCCGARPSPDRADLPTPCLRRPRWRCYRVVKPNVWSGASDDSDLEVMATVEAFVPAACRRVNCVQRRWGLWPGGESQGDPLAVQSDRRVVPVRCRRRRVPAQPALKRSRCDFNACQQVRRPVGTAHAREASGPDHRRYRPLSVGALFRRSGVSGGGGIRHVDPSAWVYGVPMRRVSTNSHRRRWRASIRGSGISAAGRPVSKQQRSERGRSGREEISSSGRKPSAAR